MTRDLVCGMDANEGSPFKSTHDGSSYVFRSASCKATFDKEPDRHVK